MIKLLILIALAAILYTMNPILFFNILPFVWWIIGMMVGIYILYFLCALYLKIKEK